MPPVIVFIIALFALFTCGLILLDAWRFRRLPALDVHAQPGETPPVSFVIPARDEATNIARCLDGALGQGYPAYEVIVVDDGSTDDTPHILAHYSERHLNRLRVVPGRPLPHGWVGKCNACLHGAHHARGAWLLFIDADTAPQPELLAAMMAHVEARRLDGLTCFPYNELPTLAERLVMPVFFQFAFTAFPVHKIASPEPPPSAAIANGQCLLVRTDAYWSLGGHEVVKDKVLEDIEFAQAFRRAGFRLGVTTAFDVMRVRMYHTLGEIVQGLGKHASAGRRASGSRAFSSVLRLTLTLLVPPILFFTCALAWVTSQGVGESMTLVTSAITYGASLLFWAHRYRAWYALPAASAFLAPAGWLIYLFIVVRGTLQVWFKRGVVWKDRVYS